VGVLDRPERAPILTLFRSLWGAPGKNLKTVCKRFPPAPGGSPQSEVGVPASNKQAKTSQAKVPFRSQKTGGGGGFDRFVRQEPRFAGKKILGLQLRKSDQNMHTVAIRTTEGKRSGEKSIPGLCFTGHRGSNSWGIPDSGNYSQFFGGEGEAKRPVNKVDLWNPKKGTGNEQKEGSNLS